MILTLAGELGEGKTCTLMYLGVLRKGYGDIIVTNISSCTFADYIVKTYTDIKELHKKLKEELDKDTKPYTIFVMFDEGWLEHDKYDTQTKKNRESNKVLLTCRKRHINLAYTQQSKLADIRLRHITNLIMLPEYDSYSKVITVNIFDRYSNFLDSFNYYSVPLWDLYDHEEVIEESEFEIELEIKNIKADKDKYKYYKKLKTRTDKVACLKKLYRYTLDEARLLTGVING